MAERPAVHRRRKRSQSPLRTVDAQRELLGLSEELLNTLDPDRALALACRAIQRLVQADTILGLVDTAYGALVPRYFDGPGEPPANVGDPGSRLHTFIHARSRGMIPDLAPEGDCGEHQQMAFAAGVRAVALVPVVSRDDELLGAIVAGWNSPQPDRGDDDVALISLAANQAGSAMKLAQTVTRLRRQEDELATAHRDLSRAYTRTQRHLAVIEQTNRLTTLMSRTLDLPRLCRSVAQYAIEISAGCHAWLYTRDAERGERVATAARDGELRAPARPASVFAETLRRGRVVNQVLRGPTDEAWQYLGLPILDGDATVGALVVAAPDYFEFGNDDEMLLTTLVNQFVGARRNIGLYRDLETTYDATLEALVAALDKRDRETEHHSRRVSVMTLHMAGSIGMESESRDWIVLHRAATLHDIGKIGVSDAILRKPGRLVPEEWAEMQRHPDMGYEILQDVPFLAPAAEIVRAHHERWDGKGYPRGLRGEDIPLGARIFTIADAFDAMTSHRPYRPAMSPEEARAEIIANRGGQFEPRMVDVFVRSFDELVDLTGKGSRETEAA